MPVTRPIMARLGCAALLALASLAPAAAQAPDATGFAVDPRAATPIVTMTGISAELCKRGSKPACEFVDKLQVATTRLVAAQDACSRGMRMGCEAVEQGVAEISVVYQRFGGGAGLARTLRSSPGAASATTPGRGTTIGSQ